MFIVNCWDIYAFVVMTEVTYQMVDPVLIIVKLIPFPVK